MVFIIDAIGISVQLTQCAHRRCDILHMRFLYSTSSFISGFLGHCCWRIPVVFLITVAGEFQ